MTIVTPWHHEPRARLTEQQAVKLFLEHGGCCRECGRKLGPADDWIIEHVVALENGGTNETANLGITCTWCKPKKDAKDHAEAGHSRRQVTKHLLPRSMRTKKPWPKRPFRRPQR